MAEKLTERVEQIAEELHVQYLRTAERLGWPLRPEVNVPYVQLSDAGKELDRVFARWHLDKLATERHAAEATLRGLREALESIRTVETASQFPRQAILSILAHALAAQPDAGMGHHES